MLIPDKVLPIHAMCSKDSGRYAAMQSILVQRDEQGSPLAVATDGKRLIVASWAEPSGDDFPDVGGAVAQVKDFRVQVSAAHWKEALGTLPKKTTYKPILGYMLLDESQEDPLFLATTDLESVRTFTPRQVEGNFPNWQNIVQPIKLMPRMSGYYVEVRVNAKLLIELLTTIGKMVGDEPVTLFVAADGQGHSPTPMQFQAASTDVKVFGILMPLEIPAPKAAEPEEEEEEEEKESVFLMTVQGEAHCEACDVLFEDGYEAYCLKDENGGVLWFCPEHVPDDYTKEDYVDPEQHPIGCFCGSPDCPSQQEQEEDEEEEEEGAQEDDEDAQEEEEDDEPAQ